MESLSMSKWKDNVRRMMAGRYGVDSFSKFLAALALVSALANFYFRSFLGTLALILLILVYARAFSRDFAKRSRENARFLAWFAPITGFYYRLLGRLKDREHRYLRCPKCKESLRVPRGKGKIRITCPKCKTVFERKT